MKTSRVALAIGTSLALVGMLTAPASARRARVVHEPPTRIVVRPLFSPAPYWDSNLVPRYHYRPQDDRVDPYGPPVVPVLRADGGWL